MLRGSRNKQGEERKKVEGKKLISKKINKKEGGAVGI